MISSSLFHFTNSKETILEIISTRKFRASYNKEEISDFYYSERFAAIPMICFCDIPLKFISEHPMIYGKYGIGLKKKWGITNEVNPILYRTNTEISKLLSSIINEVQNLSSNQDELFHQTIIKDNILLLSNYSKKYQNKNTLNYNDREWRFIPKDPEIPLLKKCTTKTIRSINNVYFKRNPDYLPFKLSDIKYIISPSKIETNKLIKVFLTLDIREKDKFYLCQRLIDLTSIKRDF